MTGDEEHALGLRMAETAAREDRVRRRIERVGGEGEPGSKSILRPRGPDGLLRIADRKKTKAGEPPGV